MLRVARKVRQNRASQKNSAKITESQERKPNQEKSSPSLNKDQNEGHFSSSDDVCDINFVSHDLVLIVLNKGQLLQYQKSGRIVWKTEIPILHVSRVKSQGCNTFVMTNYGTIYRLCLPYDCTTNASHR